MGLFQPSFRMPNKSRSRPARHLGLLMTMNCIALPAFLLLLQYKREGAGMFLFQSALVSTTKSAPLRTDRVMQSEPGAYSLLTPRGYPAVSTASVSS